ncbi:hydroxyacid dehydrogenase [Streptomyces anulatus]|uniref:hydroxyacid dehydrogenase n=1 Tax=Streptomyces TaxID=1883 RepID=UPI00099F5D7D|nr:MULTISPECIES: hydroxyacid dehydrogenase [Streptomyces]MBQ1109975.1 hydroxyacid dehydrogenase [Streptomyces sp. 404i]MDQ0693691.1 phosphoglycerate dehydrogenase-like enzyme [Streptomyces sp. W4I9-2]MDX3485069.1 hydroxyacid dehydrogenase [Streptomyces sp. ID05-18]WIY80653.1 hydroxyacid dehydrogenase [Streptomyces anulatus]
MSHSAAPQRTRPRTVLAMSGETRAAILAPEALDRLARVADLVPGLLVTDFGADDPAQRTGLHEAEVLFTGWGCPPLGPAALSAMPRLRAVVHAAGSVKHHITQDVWDRGIAVSTAATANAFPVAEYTVAAILFANKQILESARVYREARSRVNLLRRFPAVGNYRRTVGIVGASRIGRRVVELLRPYDLRVLVHDPYLDEDGARTLGVERAGLDALVARSDVVSIHAPELPATRHLFDAGRLALMQDGATLVNTARGSLVDTDALVKELVAGRLNAVLDHTEPEVLPADSPLYDLPNVLLTPHIAGSQGGELHRLADAAVDELERYAHGLPFAHAVDPRTLHQQA